MAETDVDWIIKGLKKPGKTQSGLARALGRAPSMVTSLLKGGRQLKTSEVDRIADYLEVSPPGRDTTELPIMGYIGAGAEILPEFEQVPPEGLDQIDLPFAVPPDLIGLEVRGESMLPRYEDGDVIVVWRDQRGAIEGLLGEEAAVRTERGQRFLKRILRGARKGTFNLESTNASAKTIEGARLEWASEIYLTVRAAQIRRVARRRHEAGRRREEARARDTAGMDELPLTKRR